MTVVQGSATGTAYVIDKTIARPPEDLPLDFATDSEFFAGYYCDHADLIVGFSGAIDSAAAQDLSQEILKSDLSYYCHDREFLDHTPSVILLHEKYNFLSLRSWRDKLGTSIFDIPGVRKLAIDYKSNQLIVSVNNAVGSDSQSNATAQIAAVADAMGIPADAITVQPAPNVRLTARCANPSSGTTNQGCFNPIPGGAQFHSCPEPNGTDLGACSVGVPSSRLNTATGQYEVGFVTASHCSETMFQYDGTQFYQPGYPLGCDPQDYAAIENTDPPGWSCGSYTCRNSDSLFAFSSVPMQQGTINQTYASYNGTSAPSDLSCCDAGCTRCTTNASHPRFYVRTTGTLMQGMVVERMGRTSGWTSGRVTNVCADDHDEDGHRYLCTGEATNWVEEGDSGGPVFFWNWSWGSDSVDLLGIVWGDGEPGVVFSPWDEVTQDLGTIYPLFEPTYQYAQATAGATDIGIGANGSVWIITATAVGGGDYTIQKLVTSTPGSEVWQTMPGAAKRIAVDPSGNAWVVTNSGQIYRWTGTSFQLLPGLAKDIGIGADGSVWVIGAASGDGGTYKWNGSNWTYVNGAGTRIAVDPAGNPWVVVSDTSIWRYVSGSFQHVTGAAKDIGISGDGLVWIIGTVVDLGGGGYDVEWWYGAGWNQTSGIGTAIAAARVGLPWVVTGHQQVYRAL